MRATCNICPHTCAPENGEYGLCRARKSESGAIVCANYGKLTALALDPIEKKPLHHFHPGSNILSVGSFGCNMRCQFCQNSSISMADATVNTRYTSPEGLVAMAVEAQTNGNIGIAYTYNEPLVGYEYVYDCATLAHHAGLLNVLVTNGFVNQAPLLKLLPHIDAMNIDLKAFSAEFYEEAGGTLETVKNTISTSAAHCHVEITTLIIPGLNDNVDEMQQQCAWLASIGKSIPLHITRFFPCYHMLHIPATPVDTVQQLATVARNYLKYVYTGNC